ncbi:MAG: prolyl oligopeptidase family serine peptidase [Actinomycetota bacterium]
MADDGSRIAFLRSRAGDDAEGCLWVLDVATAEERLIFDPAAAGDGPGPTQAERDRRERMREQLAGVTTYDVDPGLTLATFVAGGQVHVADLVAGGARMLEGAAEGAFDARPDPTGRRVAYVVDGSLHVQDLAGSGSGHVLARDDDPDVHWGIAEFVASEELERHRGYWWSPDGERIVAACVDERPVLTWHIASPVDPATPPRAVRYPQAGTDNAEVSLSVLGLDGSRVDPDWDRDAFPYLVGVTWNDRSPLTLLVLSRDQKRWLVLEADPASGKTQTLVDHTAEHWQTIVTGVPDRTPDGRLLFVEESQDTRRLTLDGEPVTPPGLQVATVLDVGEDVLFAAQEDPTEMHVWRGARSDRPGTVERITSETGMHVAARAGGVTVIVSELLDRRVRRAVACRDDAEVTEIRSLAEEPVLHARPTFDVVGDRDIRVALFRPGGDEPDAALPLIVDPYGGPHFSRVVKAHRSQLEAQWLADQGFAVLVADGRGTPGRGIAWEHAVYRDFAGPVLEDQVDALHAAAERFPFLDLDKVGIRGWSFGGYLAAMAVLRRPDVFHAAVAGAPVTDQTLYDTAYTERYLGLPQDEPDVYRRNSLLEDAPNLTRPLLLIHGLADDNVFVANTLRLSRALTEAGRLHSVVPLSGITHMTTDEAVAENLLLLQVRFLRQALGLAEPSEG